MPDPATVNEAAQAEVSALRQEARNHKRLSERHRHKAQKLMQELDDKIRWCHEHGITVEIDIPRAGGQQVHGHPEHST